MSSYGVNEKRYPPTPRKTHVPSSRPRFNPLSFRSWNDCYLQLGPASVSIALLCVSSKLNTNATSGEVLSQNIAIVSYMRLVFVGVAGGLLLPKLLVTRPRLNTASICWSLYVGVGVLSVIW